MLNLSHWPVARKIMAAILLLALLSGGLTLFALGRINVLAGNTEILVGDLAERARLYAGLNEHASRLQQMAYETIVESVPAKGAGILDEIRAENAEFDLKERQLEKMSVGADKAELQALMEDVRTYRALLGRGTVLAVRNDKAAAEVLLQDQAGPIYDRIDSFLDGRAEKAKEALEQGASDSSKLADTSAWSMGLAGIAGIMLIGGLSFWMIRRQIVGPIRSITGKMSSLADGNVAIELSEADRRDEIGAMAHAVVQFRDAAIARAAAEADKQRADAEQAQVVSELAVALSELSQGNLTARLRALPSSYAAIERDFNSAIDGLRATMESIVRTSGGIRNGAAEVDQASTDLSRRTEQQAASLEETAAAMEQINTTVRQTADNANKASSAVSQARSDSENGSDVIQQTVAAMTGIERASREIAEIIAVIDGIAFQTNLLALNAGVEAARAGDAGRGFAVVASEVRALAQRAADAAKDVRERITLSSVQVENGVRLVAETGDALSRINERVQLVNTLVVEIATAAEEQAVSLGQVNTAVSEMDSVTQRNAAMVEECAAASRSLASDAEQLFVQVARFDTGTGQSAPASQIQQASQPSPAAERRTVRKTGGARGNLALATAPDDDWTEF